MFEEKDCNFDAYVRLMSIIRETGRYMDFRAALGKDEFIVARHDIEFSIERAHDLAELEAGQGFHTSYLVQLTNNAYNPFSKKNLDMLKSIVSMGHNVGLHYHTNGQEDVEVIRKEIKEQAEILSSFLCAPVDRFSFHRPPAALLRHGIKVEGLLNTYSKEFFTYTDDIASLKPTDVHYLSDSNHQWKFGQPTKEWIDAHKKIQCLFHPLSWTRNGSTHVGCFKSLVEEKRAVFIETIKNEWKYFHLLEGEL